MKDLHIEEISSDIQFDVQLKEISYKVLLSLNRRKVNNNYKITFITIDIPLLIREKVQQLMNTHKENQYE